MSLIFKYGRRLIVRVIPIQRPVGTLVNFYNANSNTCVDAGASANILVFGFTVARPVPMKYVV